MTPTTSPSATKPQGSRMRRLAVLGGPTTLPISGRRWLPLYGVLHHIGRRSGREYATPVVVRDGGDAVFVPLPFGERTDWYRNAVAAGGVRVTWKGRDAWLADPIIVEATSARGSFNALMRTLMAIAGIELVVRFDPIVH